MQSGELARLAGLSTDTLRHYERLGLLRTPPRTDGGYRDYPVHALERVRLIRRALSVGFSLAELKTILAMRDRGEVPCLQARAMAENKLQQVRRQLKELLVMRNQLERLLKDWDARLARTQKGQPARLLESLPKEWTKHSLPPRLNTKRTKESQL
jgi:MerR family copper efflux transcriptional regulator